MRIFIIFAVFSFFNQAQAKILEVSCRIKTAPKVTFLYSELRGGELSIQTAGANHDCKLQIILAHENIRGHIPYAKVQFGIQSCSPQLPETIQQSLAPIMELFIERWDTKKPAAKLYWNEKLGNQDCKLTNFQVSEEKASRKSPNTRKAASTKK